MYTKASLTKIQADRERVERRSAAAANQDDDALEFTGPDPGFDSTFVSRNVSMKKREMDGVQLTPMQLLEMQQKEDALAEKGPGAILVDPRPAPPPVLFPSRTAPVGGYARAARFVWRARCTCARSDGGAGAGCLPASWSLPHRRRAHRDAQLYCAAPSFQPGSPFTPPSAVTRLSPRVPRPPRRRTAARLQPPRSTPRRQQQPQWKLSPASRPPAQAAPPRSPWLWRSSRSSRSRCPPAQRTSAGASPLTVSPGVPSRNSTPAEIQPALSPPHPAASPPKGASALRSSIHSLMRPSPPRLSLCTQGPS